MTKFPFFCYATWKPNSICCFDNGYGFWFRIFGYGLHFTNGRKLFSERNGHTKTLPLPFGYRVKFLRK